MKYLVTGGTGLIGSRLIPQLLSEGHQVWNLSRKPKSSSNPNLIHLVWDGKEIPQNAPEVDYVVNLAGAGIADKRWTDAYKQELISSRVDATTACKNYINRCTIKPQAFLTASGFNYYGSLLDQPVDETSPAGDSFMAEICKQWEGAADGAQTRVVKMRISVVLAKDGGPLAKMLTPYKFFVGGPTGTGTQGFPWIHIDDLVSAIRFLEKEASVSGPVNLVAPNPITMQVFSDAIGKALGRPNFFRLGKPVLELIFGEMSVVLWGGAFVHPNVLQKAGFQWKYPEVLPAIKNLLG